MCIQLMVTEMYSVNPLNAEWNPICHLLALLGAHPIFHISRISVNGNGSVQLIVSGVYSGSGGRCVFSWRYRLVWGVCWKTAEWLIIPLIPLQPCLTFVYTKKKNQWTTVWQQWSNKHSEKQYGNNDAINKVNIIWEPL